MKTILPLIILVIGQFVSLSLIAQDHKIAIGAGLPEVYHVEYQYQFDQSSIGANLGLTQFNFRQLSLGLNYYYHFGGQPKFETQKPWYLKASANVIVNSSYYSIDQLDFLSLRIGREINFTQKLGMSLDAGIFYLVYFTKFKLHEGPVPLGVYGMYPLLPSGCAKIFYRF